MAFEADVQGDVDDAGFGDGQQVRGAFEPHALDMPARRLADRLRELAVELERRDPVEPRQSFQGEVSVEAVPQLSEERLNVGEIGRSGGHASDASG